VLFSTTLFAILCEVDIPVIMAQNLPIKFQEHLQVFNLNAI